MNGKDPSLSTEPWSTAPASVGEALVAARADLPSADRLARLAAALPLMTPGAAPSDLHSSAGSSAGAGAVAPLPSTLSGALIGAALGLAVTGGGLLWSARSEPPRRAPIAASGPARTSPAADPDEVGKGRPIEARDQPAIRTLPPIPAARPSSALSAAAAPLNPADRTDLREAPVEDPRPMGAEIGRPSSLEDTESEAHLLERAQDALASNPSEALALAERHASRFARGVLGQEREVVAIQALLRLGRAADAKSRAQRFLGAHPGSAHRPRIEALVGP